MMVLPGSRQDDAAKREEEEEEVNHPRWILINGSGGKQSWPSITTALPRSLALALRLYPVLSPAYRGPTSPADQPAAMPGPLPPACRASQRTVR